MRYKVRAAINEWDLMRLYPNSGLKQRGLITDLGITRIPN